MQIREKWTGLIYLLCAAVLIGIVVSRVGADRVWLPLSIKVALTTGALVTVVLLVGLLPKASPRAAIGTTVYILGVALGVFVTWYWN